MKFTESTAEDAALELLEELGYSIEHGPDFGPDGTKPERSNYSEVVLVKRLKDAIEKLNPHIPADAQEEAIRKVLRTETADVYTNNRRFHQFLTEGVDVQFRNSKGEVKSDKVWLFDFEKPENNDFLAVNQFTIIESQNNRRPDIVIFVNGLPLAVVELKNPANEDTDIWSAYQQFETYKKEIPSLFQFNEALVISDGLEARHGTLTADKERFMAWKTIDGQNEAPKSKLQMEVLFKGMFEKSRFLDIVQNFITFEKYGDAFIKKMAAYHQYYAVNKAVQSTIQAISTKGDKRAGVVWHTQGSGKSLSMVFYAAKLIKEKALQNPTIVILTDRNDLDDQLFDDTFAKNEEILRQPPVQSNSRHQLRELLHVSSGGVVFTTLQKFFPDKESEDQHPLLSDRRNIIVIADEAHRSQYDFIKGFARHIRDALPNATFIGFTGTPIEKADRSTPAVFGNYIDRYDIHQAVEDHATVRIFYENRLAKLALLEKERPTIDPEFEEVTEGEDTYRKEKLKNKWARLEAMVGTPKRIKLIAKDIVEHFEKRTQVMNGKGMIVAMSRRIAVDLYNEIVKLRPEWHSDADDKGFIKVVMTGSAADPQEWQPHIRNTKRRRYLKDRMKDPQSGLNLVIVRDMWLTGFDVPSMHTMYADKPMRGHNLMQAIARVNRVFKDKDGGLIVDYLGLASFIKKAVAEYSVKDKEMACPDQTQAVAIFQEKLEIVQNLFHGFDYARAFKGNYTQRLSVIPEALDFILAKEKGKERLFQHVATLVKAFALAVPNPEALKHQDEVGFFQAVKAALAKTTASQGKMSEDLDSAINQIVSKAVTTDKVIDIYAAAGIKTPDISILSEEFLDEINQMPRKNLAVEMLHKLLNDEINVRRKKNLIQSRTFSEMLERTIRAYQNRTLETAEVIAKLIDIAKDMKKEQERGKDLGLTEEEKDFYDALEVNDSAVKILGEPTLCKIAKELTQTLRNNVTIDWTKKENVRARLRIMVKKLLKKYNYPPDKQEKATKTVLEQAELLASHWTN